MSKEITIVEFATHIKRNGGSMPPNWSTVRDNAAAMLKSDKLPIKIGRSPLGNKCEVYPVNVLQAAYNKSLLQAA